jgi:hypothetical protein
MSNGPRIVFKDKRRIDDIKSTRNEAQDPERIDENAH